jgi:dimeric dUTPase (all-alpha-NTP-PPase superfamily)
MCIGQATAIGLKIKIPMLIKSLSKRGFLSFDLSSDFLATALNNISSDLVEETHSFNWWDSKIVKMFSNIF